MNEAKSGSYKWAVNEAKSGSYEWTVPGVTNGAKWRQQAGFQYALMSRAMNLLLAVLGAGLYEWSSVSGPL